MDQLFFSRNIIIGEVALHAFEGVVKGYGRTRTISNIRINSPCSGMLYWSSLRIGTKTILGGTRIDGEFCTHQGMDLDIPCGTDEDFGVTLRYSGFVPRDMVAGANYTVSVVLTLT